MDGNGGKPNPFKEAADMCGLKKGITHDEMKERMSGCIPEYWRLKKEGFDSSEIKRELEKKGF